MSTRASTRRNAAASSSPQQIPRSTRNRTHDVSESEQAAGASGKGAKHARRGRPPKQAALSRQDLPPVEEDGTVTQASTTKDKRGRKSSGAASAMSGTTARTSLTDQDLAEMDSEQMIEKIPRLEYFSQLLLDRLAPRGISGQTIQKTVRDLKDPSLRSTKNVNTEGKELNGAIEKFGNGPSIDLSVALRAIIGVRHVDELSIGLWRPDEILYKANLAATVADLYGRLATDAPTLPLEKLDKDFPEPFLSRLVAPGNQIPGASALFKETFDLGLDIRTQLALQVLKNQADPPDLSPEEVLQEIFWLNEVTVRGWDVEGLRGKSLKAPHRKAIALRLDDIQEKIKGGAEPNGAINFHALTEAYPTGAFLQHFMSWARSRVAEIDIRVNAAGKAAAIQEAIEAEIARRNAVAVGEAAPESDAIQLNDQRPQDGPSSGEPFLQGQSGIGFGNPASIQQLKKMKQRFAKSQNPHPQSMAAPKSSLNQAPTAPMFGQTADLGIQQSSFPLDPALFGIEGEAGRASAERSLRQNHNDIQAQLQAVAGAANDAISKTPGILQEILAKNTQDAIEAHKDNETGDSSVVAQYRPGPSFLDHQINATRAEWSTQQQTQGNSSEPAEPASTSQNFNEEGGFEQDQRATAAPKRRKRPRQSNGPSGSVKKPRFQEIIPPNGGPSPDGPYPASLPEDIGQYPNIQPYYEANLRAKQVTATKSANKPPQKRRPWSVQETSLLQSLIEEHGTSWAAIKKLDDAKDKVFQTRDQVALKDKARNMKFDLLKANTPLPPHFELIPLKASQKQDLLNSHGVDVDAMQPSQQAAAQ